MPATSPKKDCQASPAKAMPKKGPKSLKGRMLGK